MTPTPALLLVGGVVFGLALVVTLLPQLAPAWQVISGLALGAAVVDFLLGRDMPALEVRREVRRSIPVGVWSKVGLRVANRSGREVELRLHDHHPPAFEVQAMPPPQRLKPGRGACLYYRFRPPLRGDGQFSGIDLVTTSPLRLWYGKHYLELPETVRVFPNFREVSRYALLATDHRLSQIGVRQRRRRGEGSDFLQLREYRSGDGLRQIDWRATSRYRRLISREYQDERDQQLVFLLDCGRRMRHAEGGSGHLDQALNAMLLLAYVAARQGDAVGFMAFGGTRRWYPPRKGGNLVREFLEQTYDIASSVEPADYLQTAEQLMPLQRRRALVVLLTNTRDEDDRDLVHAVHLLANRHLVVVADLREAFLDRTLRQPVRDFAGALRFHAVNEYLAARAARHELLQHHGVLALDLLARQLPVALVNQYLDIKASGAL